MSEISMREMLEAGVHFGHQTRYWNPQMAAYLYGHRNKIHIINLEQTKVLFQEALNFVGKLSAEKGRILFVGTKRAARQIVREEAERCGMPYVNLRWLGGLLTNYKTVKQSISRLRELEEMKTDGGMERLSKKEALHLQRELDKLERNMSGIKDMDGWPDALFVIDVGYEDIAVSEAVKLGIPVVGVVDSNNSPHGVDYVIPGNDDAIRSIRLYAKAVADAIIEGKDSVAHLGEGGDEDEFIELDSEGAPVVKEKRAREKRGPEKLDKVQVKKKATRKVVRKTETQEVTPEGVAAPESAGAGVKTAESAPPGSPDTEAAVEQEAQPEAPASEAPTPEASKTVKEKTGTEQTGDTLESAICHRVREVPAGKVAAYGQVAKQLTEKCTAQQVGKVMRDLPPDSDVPWHRITGSEGELKERSGARGHVEQRRLLEAEGVAFRASGKVDMKQHQYDFTAAG